MLSDYELVTGGLYSESGTRRLYQDVIADVPCRKEQEQTAHTVANRSERNDSEGPVLLISPAIWRPSYSMAA